jgi:hypothetical protein
MVVDPRLDPTGESESGGGVGTVTGDTSGMLALGDVCVLKSTVFVGSNTGESAIGLRVSLISIIVEFNEFLLSPVNHPIK